VGGCSFVLLKRRRVSEKSLRNLSGRDFQAWGLKKIGGKEPTSKDTALGIDGFTSMNQPLCIKQSDGLGINAIDLFASSVARIKARGGVMVAFSFSDDSIRGKIRARRNYGLEIQMVTVRELIDSRERPSY